MIDRLMIAHVLASVDDPDAGPSYSVRGLSCGLERIGQKSEIHSLAAWRATSNLRTGEDAKIHRHKGSSLPVWSRLGASNSMRMEVFDLAQSSQILHAHGLWLMSNIYPANAVSKRGSTAKLVHSLRGMLGPEALRFSRNKKRVFWLAYQRSALARADCLHATAKSELNEIRQAGMRQPVAIIPNGVNMPSIGSGSIKASERQERTVLSLGRIHPKKGLDTLIRAWAGLERNWPNWKLNIVGPDEGGHRQQLERMSRELRLERVFFDGPLRQEAKTAAYADADLFVLPSLNENFAITVAEALAHGVPVISSKGAPWSGLVENRCGWWVDQGTAPIREALHEAMGLSPDQLGVLGANGREWVQRDFSWDRVASDMVRVYRWLVGGGEPPDCVCFD